MNDRARIEQLEDELDVARETIAQLRAEFLGAGWRAPRELQLSATQERFLACMVTRGEATFEQLYLALYGHRLGGDLLPLANNVKMQAHKTRVKLAPFGLTIEPLWGRGYRLPPHERALLKNWPDPTRAGVERSGRGDEDKIETVWHASRRAAFARPCTEGERDDIRARRRHAG